MSKLHHKTLEAAVAKYGQLQGSEEEVKSAITADEKGFNPEQVETIYEAISKEPALKDQSGKVTDGTSEVPGPNPKESDQKTTTAKGKKFIVTLPFRDKDDYTKQYQSGDDVSHFKQERLAHLIKIGRVKQK